MCVTRGTGRLSHRCPTEWTPVIVLQVAVFIAGAALVTWTLLSAVRAVVLPRGEPVRLSRWVFVPLGEVFRFIARFRRDFDGRDRVLALYGPVALLFLPVAWLLLILAGYTLMDWSLGGRSWRAAFDLSGSSLITLGFSHPRALPQLLLAFSEAIFGLGLLAL